MSNLSPLANHLWQSTLFAALVWLLTLALRQNRAHVRYRLWMAASVKFLVPFSLLLTAGSRLDWRAAHVASVSTAVALQQLSQPFSTPGMPPPAVIVPSTILPELMIAIWALGFAAVSIRWWGRWRRVRLALDTSSRVAIEGPAPVMTSPSSLEPGVFGIFRPVLLLPRGIEDRLTAPQLGAILAHEFCHIRRHDNLSAALHMVVEAIFWFHPLVWWMGSRLVEERERACDESVLQAGSDPETYADAILRVCRFYLESPLPCTSGVTGAELKQRIGAIMQRRALLSVTPARGLLLAAASIAAVGGPVLIGMAQTQPTPRFEVASVKRTKDGGLKYGMRFLPGGGLKMEGITLKGLISFAYDIPEERISGGPHWIDAEAYDLLAKAEKADAAVTEEQANTAAPGTPIWNRTQLRTQELLKDRFRLAIHMDQKVTTGYALLVAKGGVKMKASTSKNPPSVMRSKGRIDGRGGSVGMLATVLQNFLGNPVVDRTGLTQTYDFVLQYAQDGGAGEVDTTPNEPSIMEALEVRLGLKLEKSRVEIKTIVVDRAEKASEN